MVYPRENGKFQWFLPKGDGFAGTHPMDGDTYEIRMMWAADGDADVWLNGKRVRRCVTQGEACAFVADLVESEGDRQAEAERLMTPAECAARLAGHINDVDYYKMTRPVQMTTQELVRSAAELEGLDAATLALPQVTHAIGAQALAAWIEEQA